MQLEGARAAIDLMRKRENVSAARAIVCARFLELGRPRQRGNASVSLGMWGAITEWQIRLLPFSCPAMQAPQVISAYTSLVRAKAVALVSRCTAVPVVGLARTRLQPRRSPVRKLAEP